MSDTRIANMEKRRERILDQARNMLGRGGFDALNLRDLADEAGVTVPTIYNLVGNKSAILKALVMGAFADYERELETQMPCPVMDMPTMMINALHHIIARDEANFRATALASDRLESTATDDQDYGFKRAPLKRYFSDLCESALDEGLLCGKLSTDALVETMLSNEQMAFRDWAHRSISLEEMCRRSLQGIYVALAADAKPRYRAKLLEAMESL